MLNYKMNRKAKKKANKKDLVPYANEVEEAAYFLSLNNEGKENKKDKKDKKLKRKRTKKDKQGKRTKKGKKDKEKNKKERTKREKRRTRRAGNPKCHGLDENDCKDNSRCTWNEFHIEDFDMNTSKGKQKLFDLKESLMKRYTKDELREYLGSEDPTYYQVYMRAKKEYDNGLRGLCGNKIFKGFELSDMLEERVEKDYPDIKSENKSKISEVDKDLGKKRLREAMKKNKPDKEIQAIIDKFGLIEKDLQEIYDKDDKRLFSGIDRFLSVDQDEVSSLRGMVEDEVKLEKKEDSELQARIDKLKRKSGSKKKKKKKKKDIKTKKTNKKKPKK